MAKRGQKAGKRPVARDPRLIIIFIITIIALMGTSSVTPAFPAIARVYGISSEQVGWLVGVFTLPGVLLTPVFGLLGDRYGRKTVLVPCLLLFSIAGGACAIAPDYETLLLLRAIQGVGSAAFSAYVAALISDFFDGPERAQAMGYNTGVIAVSAAVYPVIGGALTLLSWHYPFLLSLAGLPVAVLVAFGLPSPPTAERQTLGRYLRKLAAAMAGSQIAFLLLAGFVTFVVVYGVLVTYLPFQLERDFGATPLDYGLVMCANAAAGALTSVRLGWLTTRYSSGLLLAIAFLIDAGAVAAIPFVGSLWLVIVSVVLLGGTQMLVLAITQLQLTESVPVAQRGAALALNSMMFRLGQTVGPVMMGLVLALGGLDMVFVAAGALCMLIAPFCALRLSS